MIYPSASIYFVYQIFYLIHIWQNLVLSVKTGGWAYKWILYGLLA